MMCRALALGGWLALATACTGDVGVQGNPGPEGPPGAAGMTGGTGPQGTIGPQGTGGLDGREGGTPYYLSNRIEGVIQFADVGLTKELLQLPVVAPDDGELVIKAHWTGTVAKRDGVGFCRVKVGIRKNQDPTPFLSDDIGIFGAPLAGRLDLGANLTQVGSVTVRQGEVVLLRIELGPADSECANGAGSTQIARLFPQLELGFHRVRLTIQ